ncbi:MAG: methylmalonyl Co-A mutase-associated GTPase MeaB [Xanthomonadales bacterium]|nr:methylmalonyl Co-A mutase-associated GTPase MeaB [Xanthomonadales bacterium]
MSQVAKSAASVSDSTLVRRLKSRDVRALARAITVLENGRGGAPELRTALRGHARSALVVGITGAPGVGKSTLISALLSHLRNIEKTIAVVSVDPSSPVSGGAILGDRLRMDTHADDPGVFIRSVAARGHLGGLSRAVPDIVNAIDAFGFDIILLETVGTGQSEIEVADIADVCVVVNCPGLGDEVQAMKSGVLDIADVLVVNKADQPGASRTTRALRAMLKLRAEDRQAVPVVETVATNGEGVAQLAEALLGSDPQFNQGQAGK